MGKCHNWIDCERAVQKLAEDCLERMGIRIQFSISVSVFFGLMQLEDRN